MAALTTIDQGFIRVSQVLKKCFKNLLFLYNIDVKHYNLEDPYQCPCLVVVIKI